MRYLLDTDHISVLQQGKGASFDALNSRIARHPKCDISLSIISFHEQALGCHSYINRARTTVDVCRGYRMFERLMSDYVEGLVLPFDPAASAVFDELQAQRVRISTMDLRIASIALARAHTLLTRLVDFRQVPGLTTEDWTA